MNPYIESVRSYLHTLNEAVRPYRRHMVLTAGIVLTVLILAVVALAFIARETMPDDALYTLKVNVYEPAVMTTKMSDRARLDYGVKLLGTRFDELLSLRDNNIATAENVAPLIARAAETTSVLYETMSDDSLTNEERLDTLFAATVQMKAMETITQETEQLTHAQDAFGKLLGDVSDNLTENVTVYATSTNLDRVKQYIGTHIDAVSALLPQVANGSAAQKQALARIEVMQEEVETGNFAKAIIAILRAEEALTVDGMVWGSERGESPVTAPAATTTEGQ